MKTLFLASNRLLFIGLFVSLSAICGSGLSGCGYTLQGSQSVLPPDIKKVYIPIVENNSSEASLTLGLTDALRDRFERHGAVQVVDSPSEADAVLKARIVRVNRGSRATSADTNNALQQDVTLVVAGELRRVTGTLLWANSRLSKTAQIGSTAETVVASSANFAGGGISSDTLAGLGSREVLRGQEQEVLNQLAEEVAKKAYEEAVLPSF